MLAPRDRLILALDVPSVAAATALVEQLGDAVSFYKIGYQLAFAGGLAFAETLVRADKRVFLDLKLHDIPNTVAGAVRSAGRAGASLLNVHAGGGEKMMRAAVQASNTPGAPRLLAVTVLTSMDAAELAGVGVPDAPVTQVLRLARLAQTAGIDGLVCSAEEVAAVREVMGPNALLVTPGIRPAGADVNDQSRVVTPAAAIAAGASMLVVGRPITQAADPAQVTAAILEEIANAT